MLPWSLSGEESSRRPRRRGFEPWVGKIPWRRVWQPTPVFLPGEFHGQSSLAGYSPWGTKNRTCSLWGFLVPQPGTEPGCSAVIAWSPNLCTARELPTWSLIKTKLGSTPPNNLPFCILLPKLILCIFLKSFNLRVQITTSLAFPMLP